LEDLFVLFDKNGDYAKSWSKPNKVPVFRTKSAAEQNIKHYRGEGIHIIKFVATGGEINESLCGI
jgi:hypothetical protein